MVLEKRNSFHCECVYGRYDNKKLLNSKTWREHTPIQHYTQSSTHATAVLSACWPIGSSASGISTDSTPAVKLALINKVKQIQLLSIKINTHMQQYAHKPQHISTLQNQGDKASGFVLILTCEYNLKIYDRRKSDKELAFLFLMHLC